MIYQLTVMPTVCHMSIIRSKLSRFQRSLGSISNGGHQTKAKSTNDTILFLHQASDSIGQAGIELLGYLKDLQLVEVLSFWRHTKLLIGDTYSDPATTQYWRSTGICVGAHLVQYYHRPLYDMLRRRGIKYTGYPDDTQIQKGFSFRGTDGLQSAVPTPEACLTDAWIRANKLNLHPTKTEFMVIASRHQQLVVERIRPVLRLDDTFIHCKKVVRNLGVLMTLRCPCCHVYPAQVYMTRYCHLQTIGRIRANLTEEASFGSSTSAGRYPLALDYANRS